MSLATVEDLATYLRRDLDAADAASAQQVLDIATEAIKAYTGQHIERVVGDVVELWATGTNLLVLPERPVESITTVEEFGAAFTDYRFTSGGLLWRKTGNWPKWADDNNIVEVTYTHGYATIPEDIQGVCVEMATRALENPAGLQRDDLNTASQWLGLTEENRAMLDRYRLVVAA